MGLCREKRARAKILGRCGRSSLSSIWNLEEPSTFCESWHRGGHGGVLGSSRFGLLLFFDFWLQAYGQLFFQRQTKIPPSTKRVLHFYCRISYGFGAPADERTLEL